MPEQSEASRLLRLVLRGPGEGSEGLRALVPKVRDWQVVLNLAHRHRIIAPLYLRISEFDAQLPGEFREHLGWEYRRNAFHCLANAAELVAVLSAFEAEKIPALPVKGAVLAAAVYPDLTARHAGDVDILIHQQNLTLATSLLLHRGYEVKNPVATGSRTAELARCESRFEREADGMVLELRWKLELAGSRFHRDLGLDWAWPRRRMVKLAGVEVPSMEPEQTLLHISMHGSEHLWARLVWVHDVAQLLQANPDLDWKRVFNEARRAGLWKCLELGVLLANRVCNARVPNEILRRFQADRTIAKLAGYMSENLWDDSGPLPKSFIPFKYKLLDFHDQIRLAMSPDLLRPNDRDREFVQLPKALHPLYYLIRPLRLLRDRAGR